MDTALAESFKFLKGYSFVMGKGDVRKRCIYLIVFILIVGIEVLIALFVHDSFIRPYVGDVLVIGVIYCFVRIFFPNKMKLLPMYIFLFATAVEIGQYFDYVKLLGLSDSRFFRILLGTSFSWYDIICYAVGASLCFGVEFAVSAGAQRKTDLV